MFLRTIQLTVMMVVSITGIHLHAGQRHGRGAGILDQTGCGCCCPVCGYYCDLEAKVVDEKIKGFDVESKVICIPRVVFPWQQPKCNTGCGACDGVGCSACVNNGARLRRVCKLKADSKTCPKCEYTWTAKNPCEEARKAAEAAKQTGDMDTSSVETLAAPINGPAMGYSEALQYPTPLDIPSTPDRGLVPVEIQGPPGMDEALKFPTPLRPSRDQ